MSRNFSAMIFRTLVVSLVAIGLSAITSLPTPARAQDASAKAAAASGLAATLSARGRVSVIVRLSGNFQPEHALAGPEGAENSIAVAVQRAAIRQGQDRVLADLAGISVGAATRFSFVPFMAMSVDGPGLQALVDSPAVIGIEENRVVRPTLFESIPLIGGDVSTGFPVGVDNYSGAGQMIAILDSGVQSTHPFLLGKVLSEACYSTHQPSYDILSLCPGNLTETVDPGSGEPCLLSIQGCDHGTHVAGIAAGKTTNILGTFYSGVAKDANILAIQVFTRFDNQLDCGGPAFTPCIAAYFSDVVKGLERVYALRLTYSIASANMSLGGGFAASYCDSDLPSMKAIIDLLRDAGIASVISSGNDGFQNGTSAPACISSAVTVGSSTKSDLVSFFSNNSPTMVDLLAPGSAIGSSIPIDQYESKDGTSMAAPHVAGAFAVLKSRTPTATVNEMENALRSTGTTITETRLGVLFAKPRINIDLALAFETSKGVVADFNADAISDILFHNSANGRAVVWQMNGMTKESTAQIGNPPKAWQVEELSDFNGDGHADILWRHGSTNSLAMWLMDGFTRMDAAVIGNLSSVWQVAGYGDFDGDSYNDILWRHQSTGSTVIWLMSGFLKLDAQSIGAPPTAWEVKGVADFSGDGKADILWRLSTNGAILVWEMDGFTKIDTPSIISAGTVWDIEGVGDFNGGGQPDILWRNVTTGSVVIWQMNGYVREDLAPIATPSFSWQTARLGDYNGGGQADILWHRPSDGGIAIWQMNGFVREDAQVIGAPLGWEPQ